jgi:hypothetical protein
MLGPYPVLVLYFFFGSSRSLRICFTLLNEHWYLLIESYLFLADLFPGFMFHKSLGDVKDDQDFFTYIVKKNPTVNTTAVTLKGTGMVPREYRQPQH